MDSAETGNQATAGVRLLVDEPYDPRMRPVALDFDDVRDLQAGFAPWLRRWLPWGGDRHPLVVVQRRGTKVSILRLPSLEAAEEVAQRLRSELGGRG